MDWAALSISCQLALATALVLAIPGLLLARWLAYSSSRWRPLFEALLAVPLILPPTVLGFYLLATLGAASPLGSVYQQVFGRPLAFSFAGLLVASVVFNLPFTVMPMQRGFAAIAPELLDAAQTCGLSRWRTLWRIELPLAWPALVAALIMTAAHTTDDSRWHALAMLSDVLRHHAIDTHDLYAVASFLARTKSRLLTISLEDLLGVIDQPNIPGTVNEHPNWRQRLPLAIDRIAAALDIPALKTATAERTHVTT